MLLRLLPDACLDRLFLLFPDPWPKARHAKRRFVHPALLPLIARVLKPGAEWRIASDDPTYQAWVAAVMAEQTLFAAGRSRRRSGRTAGRQPATRPRLCKPAAGRATGPSDDWRTRRDSPSPAKRERKGPVAGATGG